MLWSIGPLSQVVKAAPRYARKKGTLQTGASHQAGVASNNFVPRVEACACLPERQIEPCRAR